jgi:type I restriction-modification system DNA methylase subunit
MKATSSFEALLKEFEYKYPLAAVFDDFLIMSICSVTQNPATGISYYEDIYLETIKKYKDDHLRFHFPKLFAGLVKEMDERVKSEEGNDVLGEFYVRNLYKRGTSQYFTPWPVCLFMAQSCLERSEKHIGLHILDPACGSGRMLLAMSQIAGTTHYYYGIDIDPTCVHMSSLNLFLNGRFDSEILCGNALIPEDFSFSHVISFAPFGIFRINIKSKSNLWCLLRDTLKKKDVSENKGVNEGGTQFTLL